MDVIALMKHYMGLLDCTGHFLNVFYYMVTKNDKSETKNIKNMREHMHVLVKRSINASEHSSSSQSYKLKF